MYAVHSLKIMSSRKKFMEDPRLYDPSLTEADPRFGSIQGIPVGTKFASRFITKFPAVKTSRLFDIEGENAPRRVSTPPQSLGFPGTSRTGRIPLFCQEDMRMI